MWCWFLHYQHNQLAVVHQAPSSPSHVVTVSHVIYVAAVSYLCCRGELFTLPLWGICVATVTYLRCHSELFVLPRWAIYVAAVRYLCCHGDISTLPQWAICVATVRYLRCPVCYYVVNSRGKWLKRKETTNYNFKHIRLDYGSLRDDYWWTQ